MRPSPDLRRQEPNEWLRRLSLLLVQKLGPLPLEATPRKANFLSSICRQRNDFSLSLSLSLFLCLSLTLSLSLSLSLSLPLSLSPSVSPLCLSPSLSLSLSLSLPLYLCLSFCFSVCPQPHFLQTKLVGRVTFLNNFGSFIKGRERQTQVCACIITCTCSSECAMWQVSPTFSPPKYTWYMKDGGRLKKRNWYYI